MRPEVVKIISGGTVTFDRADWQVPDSYPLADSTVVPLLAGETLEWQLTGHSGSRNLDVEGPVSGIPDF